MLRYVVYKVEGKINKIMYIIFLYINFIFKNKVNLDLWCFLLFF